MKKVFWGGGTVAIATSSDNFHVLKCKPSDKFEDGTVAFLDILSLQHVFAFAESLGGVPAIQVRYSLPRSPLGNRMVKRAVSQQSSLACVRCIVRCAVPAAFLGPRLAQKGIAEIDALATSTSAQILTKRQDFLRWQECMHRGRRCTQLPCRSGASSTSCLCCDSDRDVW